VVDAISFGPALIINGESVPILGSGGGLNPRTAIGQRADGAILLLVIDGRQPHSIGATLRDVADVMADFGAVNAANLDGGSSTLMVYNGEILNSTSLLTGPRRIPTAIVVSKAK
jgi:exopolysaccharide biosynthesis protein